MKSAYELAMERLQKSSPSVALTDDQKRRLADLDAEYKAKIADRDIFLKNQIEKAAAAGDFESIEQLEKQLVNERKALQAELEDRKEAIRQEKT